jgi:hypothetical protein
MDWRLYLNLHQPNNTNNTTTTTVATMIAKIRTLKPLPPPLLGERAGFGGVLGTVQFEPDQPVAQTHVPFPSIPWLHVPC